MGDQQSRPAFLSAAVDGKGAVQGSSEGTAGDGGVASANGGSSAPLENTGNWGDASAAGGAAPASIATTTGGGATAEEPMPTESEILAKLVTVLGQCPNRTLALEDIRDNLPPVLRRMTAEDEGSVRRWLERFQGLLEVSGPPGHERVTLIVGLQGSASSAASNAAPAPAPAPAAMAAPEEMSNGHHIPAATAELDDAAEDDAVSVCMVQLRGLPYRATVADIKGFLGAHTRFLSPQEPSIRLLLNRDGRPSGFAKVQFRTPEAARDCREELHKKQMGDRYVEVLACAERASRARNRRTGEADMAMPVAPAALDPGTEAMERERILQECRDHMRIPGRNTLLLSMLGIALSAPARAYLRRANLGLKHFLVRHPQEFRIDGPKGCERVIWCPMGYDYSGLASLPGNFVQSSATAIAAAIMSGASPEVATAAAMAAGAPPETAPAMAAAAAAVAMQQSRGASWNAMMQGMNFGAQDADDGYGALEAAANMATAAASAQASAQSNGPTSSAAAQRSALAAAAAEREPSTPKLKSPAPHRGAGSSAHCMATPSDWGTPGLGDHGSRPSASTGGGSAAVPDMATYGAGWPGWPAPWAQTWPAPWPDPNGMAREASSCDKAPGGRRAAGGANGAAAANGTANGASAANGAAGANGASSRSHAHLHPQSNPFAHLQRSGADGAAQEQGGTSGGGSGERAPASDEEEAEACLRLRGLPFSMTVQDVLAFFSHHDVADCIANTPGATQLLPKANGRPSGQAVVKMRSCADAETAMNALAHQWTGGRYIEVFAYDRDGEPIGNHSAMANGAGAAEASGMPKGRSDARESNNNSADPLLPLPGVGSAWMPWAGLLPPPVLGAPAAALSAPPAPSGGRDGDMVGEDQWSALFNFLHYDPSAVQPVGPAPGAVTAELASRATLQV